MNLDRRRLLGSLALGAASVSSTRGWAGETTPVSEQRSCHDSNAIVLSPGRQLFVDNFLILESTLQRTFHKALVHEGGPIFKPTTVLEMNNGNCPTACPFDDGVFYDPSDRTYKMWYQAGWFDGNALATSENGIDWKRPDLDVEPGTNRVLARRDRFQRDGSSIWLDHETVDPAQRFKMFAYFRERIQGFQYDQLAQSNEPAICEGGGVYTSPDGIHWSKPTSTGACGDNSSFFFNPFRKSWFYNLRSYDELGRYRSYRECVDLVQGAHWTQRDVNYWASADPLDEPDPDLKYTPQLYKLTAVAYESVLLGMFGIYYGPPNTIAESQRVPKIIDLQVGFSRDGLTWERPDRNAFIACSRSSGTWNRGYLHAAGGVCLVVKDKLHFYFSAFSGISPKLGAHMYAGGSTGLATLRRDGFVSMDADHRCGHLTTRPIMLRGKYLFVNVDASAGELRAELLDNSGKVLSNYSQEECIAVRSDTTIHQICWRNKAGLPSHLNAAVGIRFYLTNGQLYSFWVSSDPTGASRGYVAAGGPGFTGSTDTEGLKAYYPHQQNFEGKVAH